MNNIKSLFFYSFILLAAIGCKESDMEILGGGVWEIESVTHETRGDLTSYYTNFSMTFKEEKVDNYDGTYLVSGGGEIFSHGSGMYKFDKKSQVLDLDNGMTIDTQVSETRLTLTFTANPSSARTKGLAGEYVFVLVKN